MSQDELQKGKRFERMMTQVVKVSVEIVRIVNDLPGVVG